MEIKSMQRYLLWLVGYLQQDKIKEFENLKNMYPPWSKLGNQSSEEWVNEWKKYKSSLSLRIEEALCELKLINGHDRSFSDELTMPALRAMAQLLKIVEYNQKISAKDLEELIDLKLKELHVPNIG